MKTEKKVFFFPLKIKQVMQFTRIWHYLEATSYLWKTEFFHEQLFLLYF